MARRSSCPVPLKDCVNIGDRLRKNRKSLGHFKPQTDYIKNAEKFITEKMSLAHKVDEMTSQSAVGGFYGLPSRVKDILRDRRGINSLYDWQREVISMEGVRKGENIILSLPTSGGKTLMAELFALKQILCQRRNVILVLPFVAIVKEKVDSLTEFSVELDFRVEEYAGGRGQIPPVKRRHNSVYICTIEKANSLFDSLLESSRVDELGLVIVDELHMVGEGPRGALLEGLMTKMMFGAPHLQLLGMSSTLSRVENLTRFMSAHFYSSPFRPVALAQFVKLGNSVFRLAKGELEHCRTLSFPYTKEMAETDCDQLAGLVSEVVPRKSCLIFCPTRKNCENISQMLCKLMPKKFRQIKVRAKIKLLEDLEAESSGNICPILKQTIVYGVAYHHGGLTNEDRKLLEMAFSAKVLLVLCCTSTLAAGVNLPAQRVIIRSPFVGIAPLSPSQYRQMSGRAGRAGLDEVGESYLIVNEETKDVVTALVDGPDDSCCSHLLADDRFASNLMLSVVGFGLVTSDHDLARFARMTLAFHQLGEEVINSFRMSLHRLEEANLVTPNLKVTPLGRAVWKGSIDFSLCTRVYEDLRFGLSHGLILNTNFHLLSLVTPYDVEVRPDFRIMLQLTEKLSQEEYLVMNRMGIFEDFIIRSASNNKVREKVDASSLSRFYLCLMLNCLCGNKSIVEVADIFQINRGFVQNLINSAGSFASNLLHFVEELDEFWAYKVILPSFISRLNYAMNSELAPLLTLPFVSQIRAKQFFKAGFKTLQSIAHSSARDVSLLVPNVTPGVAIKIIRAAMVVLLLLEATNF